MALGPLSSNEDSGLFLLSYITNVNLYFASFGYLQHKLTIMLEFISLEAIQELYLQPSSFPLPQSCNNRAMKAATTWAIPTDMKKSFCCYQKKDLFRVRSTGLEPAQLSPLAPQASVSTNSTTTARQSKNLGYFRTFVNRIGSIFYNNWYHRFYFIH